MNKKSVIFFGSFLHYSTKVAQSLLDSPFIDLIGVVTPPPAIAGKQKVLKNTHTHDWANQNNITIYAPEDLFNTHPSDVFSSGDKPDFFIVAGYGKLLPQEWLQYPKIASLNLHFSLLPDFRGANPAEWAILLGETETGVTLIDMSHDFDTGNIITRLNIPIDEQHTRETLYEELYDLAANIASETIPHLENTNFADPQAPSDKPYAYRHNRSHGFIDWQFVHAAIEGHHIEDPLPLLSKNLKIAWKYLHEHPNESEGLITPEVFLERAVRALSGYPGIWTYLPTSQGKKRMKILSTNLDEGILTLDQVQIEGKQPSTFNQIKNQIA